MEPTTFSTHTKKSHMIWYGKESGGNRKIWIVTNKFPLLIFRAPDQNNNWMSDTANTRLSNISYLSIGRKKTQYQIQLKYANTLNDRPINSTIAAIETQKNNVAHYFNLFIWYDIDFISIFGNFDNDKKMWNHLENKLACDLIVWIQLITLIDTTLYKVSVGALIFVNLPLRFVICECLYLAPNKQTYEPSDTCTT